MLCKANHMTLQATDLTTCMVLFFEKTLLVVHAEIGVQVAERVCSILSMFFSFYHIFSSTKKKI